jgi:hypothetical protein
MTDSKVRLATKWTQHLKTDKEKNELRSNVLASLYILNVLKNIVSSMTKKTKDKDFDSASWAYKRAYQDGYNEALEDVNKLIPDID